MNAHALTPRLSGGAPPRAARVHCVECDARLEPAGRRAGEPLTCTLCGTELIVGGRRARRLRRKRTGGGTEPRSTRSFLAPGMRRTALLAALVGLGLLAAVETETVLALFEDLRHAIAEGLARVDAR